LIRVVLAGSTVKPILHNGAFRIISLLDFDRVASGARL
jgi:hypothetical protein